MKRPQPLLRQLLCPYCWERFPPEELLWIAHHDDLRGDPVLGGEAFRRFLPTRFSPQGDALDARGMKCQKLACPQCRQEVPRTLLHHQMVILSTIGVPGSGKSYFLTAMTWQLRHLLPNRFALHFSDVDTQLNRILNDYEQVLFYGERKGEPVAIEKTELEGHLYVGVNLRDQPVRLPRPFVFDLKPGRGHRLEQQPISKTGRAICLYDNAGEHFLPGADTAAAPGTQHLARSRMLMFLYDPTKDPRFRELCRGLSDDPQLGPHAQTRRQETVLNEAFRRIRQHTNTPPGERLQRPLVVLVAKSDIWAPLIDDDLRTEPILTREGGRTELDIERIDAASAQLRGLMQQVAPEFVAMAENETEPVVYLPVSALGCSPVVLPEQQLLMVHPERIRPSWVTVPVLYAFSRWAKGLIDLPEG
ncbi:MAG: hypothetical protein ACOCTI_07390 [Phycisphaeraceae bacterium]